MRTGIDRRAALQATGASPAGRRTSLKITGLIRYQIGPFERDEFQKYAGKRGRIIPPSGGHPVGTFCPRKEPMTSDGG